MYIYLVINVEDSFLDFLINFFCCINKCLKYKVEKLIQII